MPKGCAEREGQVKGLLYGPTETTVTGAVNRHDLISLPSYRPACLYRLTLTAGLSHETGLVPSTHPPLPPLQIPTPIRWSVVSPPAPDIPLSVIALPFDPFFRLLSLLFVLFLVSLKHYGLISYRRSHSNRCWLGVSVE